MQMSTQGHNDTVKRKFCQACKSNPEAVYDAMCGLARDLDAYREAAHRAGAFKDIATHTVNIVITNASNATKQIN